MSSSKQLKVSKQHEKTWCDLHRRLISLPFSFENMFPEEVYQFINNQAIAISSSIEYLVPCLLTTTAFVTGLNGSSVSSSSHQRMPINLYSIVVGPPTTGKSQAMKECTIDPLVAVRDNNDLGNFLVERCTTSALVKCVSEQRRAVVVSPEVYDVLNKMLKNEEENGSGEVQMLCELFSGERASFRYATEKIREIPENLPFGFVGCTQVLFAARLICRMNQGHGLLDRFMFWFPVCLRPSPQETEVAKGILSDIPIKSFTDVFLEMFTLHLSKKVFSFTQSAQKMIDSLQFEFIIELNEAITEGVPAPKSKRVDLVQRLAVSLHVLTHVTTDLIRGRKPSQPPKDVNLETVKKSVLLLEYVESQKQIIIEFIDSLTAGSVIPQKMQPTLDAIKIGVLLFPGPVITKRSFKQSAARNIRGITDSEFITRLEMLEKDGCGIITKLRPTADARKETIVFVKVEILPDHISLVPTHEYTKQFQLPLHRVSATITYNEFYCN